MRKDKKESWKLFSLNFSVFRIVLLLHTNEQFFTQSVEHYWQYVFQRFAQPFISPCEPSSSSLSSKATWKCWTTWTYHKCLKWISTFFFFHFTFTFIFALLFNVIWFCFRAFRAFIFHSQSFLPSIYLFFSEHFQRLIIFLCDFHYYHCYLTDQDIQFYFCAFHFHRHDNKFIPRTDWIGNSGFKSKNGSHEDAWRWWWWTLKQKGNGNKIFLLSIVI